MKRTGLLLMLLTTWMCVSAANLQVKKAEVKCTWGFSNNTEEYASDSWTPGVEANIDFPTGNDKLSQTIIKWMASALGVQVKVYKDADELVNAYADNVKTGEMPDTKDDLSINKVYETNKLVSYEVSGYEYSGGAHGMPYRYGVTFRKSDCKEMGKLLVKANAKLNLLLRKGLKKHFEAKNDAELRECLFDTNLNKLERPNNSPWVIKEGIIFQYGAYEIAAYAYGMPEAVIPVSQILPYLTVEGKALVK